MPNREEKIASYKTLIDLHFHNIERSQRRLFELRRWAAMAGDEVAFNETLIEDEMREIHRLEVLLKHLEHVKENEAELLRSLTRLASSFGMSRKPQ